jgi:hypothetical protein
MMVRLQALLIAATFASASAWVSSSSTVSFSRTSTRVNMAIDYNDPVVAQEFSQVQPMAFEDVEYELRTSGIRVPPTMNDMEAKLMLVEMRLRMSGRLGGKEPKKQPAKFSSKLEEFMWTKPAFNEFYTKLKENGDPNALNVVAEFVNVSYSAFWVYVVQTSFYVSMLTKKVNTRTRTKTESRYC